MRYESGEEISKGDKVLFHRVAGEIEFVVDEPTGDPEKEWLIREFGAGVMIADPIGGHTFLTATDTNEDLKFVSRA